MYFTWEEQTQALLRAIILRCFFFRVAEIMQQRFGRTPISAISVHKLPITISIERLRMRKCVTRNSKFPTIYSTKCRIIRYISQPNRISLYVFIHRPIKFYGKYCELNIEEQIIVEARLLADLIGIRSVW